MKKTILSAALLAMLPLLMGSAPKEPAHLLLPVADAFLTSTASVRTFQTTETKEYFFRYIFLANLPPNAGLLENDRIAPDVNIFTQLAGVIPRGANPVNTQAQLVIVDQLEAQKLFDAIENRRPFQAFRPGNPGVLPVRAEPSFSYPKLWRYFVSLGRGTLYNAYGVGNCGGNIIGFNGQEQNQCDAIALSNVRACLRVRATGIRVAPDRLE